ncbi:phospholipase [Rheinheimera riviphila]|uniref:Phospholipase n=1 Tax=Rheinheimera riviphila TaxID=1834037 RepID=A0A437QLP8_9GAMM|nr:phospholipase [Rheinheimera riviphila]RVU35380.1 phospholipase [Rheinheimera riviphila]
MLVVFVHGWSVSNTDTYGGLPEALARLGVDDPQLRVNQLFLGKYISFADEVKVDDIARGMQFAVNTEILPLLQANEKFACITHSTGGPVVRCWLELYFKDRLAQCPMQHLIMLAPANHGSSLAQLGKSRVSRLKSLTLGIEPGIGVLDWLELGSDQSWQLNQSWLHYQCVAQQLFVFVLTGQSIDRALYDHLNSYTGEPGTDGVVRVAAANLNYAMLRLVQQQDRFELQRTAQAETYAFGILPGLAHAGDAIGIMSSVKADDGSHPTLYWVRQCLQVQDAAGYRQLSKDLAQLTKTTQKQEHVTMASSGFLFDRKFITSRYSMLVFRMSDDRGNPIHDYDIKFTAGPDFNENHLPSSFCVDRQLNQQNPGKLTYYVDFDVLKNWLKKPELADCFGFKIQARPSSGFAYYQVAEYQGSFKQLSQDLAANQTLMIEIVLKRVVHQGIFQLSSELQPEDFGGQQVGNPLPDI